MGMVQQKTESVIETSPQLTESLHVARELATKADRPEVLPLHLLLAMLSDDEASFLLEAYGVDFDKVRAQLLKKVEKQPKKTDQNQITTFSHEIELIMNHARREAEKNGLAEVDSNLILAVALSQKNSEFAKLMQPYDLDLEGVLQYLELREGKTIKISPLASPPPAPQSAKPQPASATPAPAPQSAKPQAATAQQQAAKPQPTNVKLAENTVPPQSASAAKPPVPPAKPQQPVTSDAGKAVTTGAPLPPKIPKAPSAPVAAPAPSQSPPAPPAPVAKTPATEEWEVVEILEPTPAPPAAAPQAARVKPGLRQPPPPPASKYETTTQPKTPTNPLSTMTPAGLVAANDPTPAEKSNTAPVAPQTIPAAPPVKQATAPTPPPAPIKAELPQPPAVQPDASPAPAAEAHTPLVNQILSRHGIAPREDEGEANDTIKLSNRPAKRRRTPDLSQGSQHHLSATGSVLEKGRMVERIPRKMQLDKPSQAEVRITRTQMNELSSEFSDQSGGHIHDLVLTEAMTVQLRAPGGGFHIENLSPQTQWIDRNQRHVDDADFGAWRWNVIPTKPGKARLQLVISARTVDEEGNIHIADVPDKILNIGVQSDHGKILKSVGAFTLVGVGGLIAGKFGQAAFTYASTLIGSFN